MNSLNKPYYFISVCLVFLLSSPDTKSETIDVGILTSAPIQKSIYVKYVENFESQNPSVKVNLIFKPDAEFKEELPKWLASGNGPSILSWQAGERLNQFIRRDQIKNLNTFFEKYSLVDNFSQASVNATSYEGTLYAVPLSYYQWGFYYRESVFKLNNIEAPKTWDELLDASKTLKDNGITPFTIGSKNNWPVAAWFDYLNLRINGLDFHLALLSGRESYLDPRVKKVFDKWKQLIDAGFFLEQSDKWAWLEAMPYMYHQKAGMTLIGNFFSGSMPKALVDDFKFFKFPVIDGKVAMYEEAPLDLLMVPQYANFSTNVQKLLLVFASKEFQAEFNEVSGMISPNIKAGENQDYFIQQGQKTLAEAKGLSQFFDRDTSQEMAASAIPILKQFLINANIDKTTDALEKARIQHF
jgi:multiple sugar transport system substrate-binding protein